MEGQQERTPIQYTAAAIRVHPDGHKAHEICFRLHWHNRMEIIRLHRGELLAGVGNGKFRLCAGEVLLIPPKAPHTGTAGAAGAVYDVLTIDIRSFYNDTELCRTYLPALYEGRARLQHIATHPQTVQAVDGLCNSTAPHSLATIAGVYHLLSLIFQHNVQELCEIGRDDMAAKAIVWMEENFSQNISTASISARFGYTAAHFCRKFKKATGLAPMTYLKIYRLEKAHKELQNGKRSISEIAADCGFSDTNYFTRCFRAHFGAPPTQYRRH